MGANYSKRKRRASDAGDSAGTRRYTSHSRTASGVMIHSLKVNGYRGFSKYAMNDLTRINLLVGKNNCGKTTLLEALYLLWAGADITALWQILNRRGEQSAPEQIPGRGIQQEVDISHLFTGHKLIIGESEFSIGATNESPAKSIKYQIVEPKPQENPALFNQLLAQDPTGAAMSLKITGAPKINLPPIPINSRGGIRADVYSQALTIFRAAARHEHVQFIQTEALNAPELNQLWNQIALKPEQELVLRALRFIDPEIEQFAPLTQHFWIGSQRGGFIAKRKHEDSPVPIGSFGDGIWRIFSLAIALSTAKNGLLLIDEIDTGLHFSVMTEMWRFVDEVSRAFNVQVFATSHSYDCIHSLATVCREVETDKSEITIHRIEAGKQETIRFTEAQIKIAADRDLEIR
jgi:ABC-type branched-subunit amino acid transport system ATPase component